MAKNKIEDLRNHLFAALEGLSDPDNPMEITRAHAICEVSQTIINTAKVEVDLVRAVGASKPGSAFFGAIVEESRDLPHIPERRQLDSGAAPGSTLGAARRERRAS
jgi:hypothetical protein